MKLYEIWSVQTHQPVFLELEPGECTYSKDLRYNDTVGRITVHVLHKKTAKKKRAPNFCHWWGRRS